MAVVYVWLGFNLTLVAVLTFRSWIEDRRDRKAVVAEAERILSEAR